MSLDLVAKALLEHPPDQPGKFEEDVISRWVGVVLFIIGIVMGVLTNLVSGDLESWYDANRVVAWLIIVALTSTGAILTFLGREQEKDANITSGEQVNIQGRKSTVAELSSTLTSLERQLSIARQVLDVYEQQAAGYTTLTIPAQLQFNLDEQRTKVMKLEAEIKALRTGRRDEY